MNRSRLLHRAVVQPVLVATLLAAVSPLAAAPAPVAPASTASPPRGAPIDLGSHSYRVTTASAEAQQAFDRGLTHAYAFAHTAAEREFRRAIELDPNCAMAWWGVALVNGPHINFPLVPPDKAKTAWEALSHARDLAPKASETERALIEALGKRYAEFQPEDRRPLDIAYADGMRALWKAHPDDADIATLFAESMMDLRPWDLWTPAGKPQPGTEEIVATLERALQLNPKHPGANHLYIHAVEASKDPQKAVEAADRLGPLAPGAGHLVHMPAHIYARVGRWADVVTSNRRAMVADRAYRAQNPRPGFYAMYMLHNAHFLAYGAMMRGQSEVALKAAREMVAGIPPEFIRDNAPVADGYTIFVPEVLMRFGRWKEILAEQQPPETLPYARAMWRFLRGVAYTSLGQVKQAKAEREALRKATAALPEGWTFGMSKASTLLAIAGKTLDGEMAAQRGDLAGAAKLLREAVAIEDQLPYDEPPDWMQPTRHTLGAVLLRGKRYAEAETVYREDLARYPENGWSLYGLGRALRLQKKNGDAVQVETRFKKMWNEADFQLTATCLCQPGV